MTGGHAGWVLSRERTCIQGADLVGQWGRQHGLVSLREAGTPQGSPRSPLLSNILLDDLDKELERRGHHVCRYADDVNIYVASRRAGERVMVCLVKSYYLCKSPSFHRLVNPRGNGTIGAHA